VAGPSTCVPVCSDGYTTTEEQCDDFNSVNLDGCDSTCLIEAGWTCAKLAN